MLSVAPVLSSITPIIAPKIIRNPIEAIVEPKPSLRVLTIFPPGRVTRARNNDTMNKTMKAFILSLDVSHITAIILRITKKEIVKIFIPGI